VGEQALGQYLSVKRKLVSAKRKEHGGLTQPEEGRTIGADMEGGRKRRVTNLILRETTKKLGGGKKRKDTETRAQDALYNLCRAQILGITQKNRRNAHVLVLDGGQKGPKVSPKKKRLRSALIQKKKIRSTSLLKRKKNRRDQTLSTSLGDLKNIRKRRRR